MSLLDPTIFFPCLTQLDEINTIYIYTEYFD